MLPVNLDSGLMWLTSFVLYFGRNCSQLPLGQRVMEERASIGEIRTRYPAANRKLVVWPLTSHSLQQAVTCGMKCLHLWIWHLSLLFSLSEGFPINRGQQIPPKHRHQFQILDARNVTWKRSNTKDPKFWHDMCNWLKWHFVLVACGLLHLILCKETVP
jgi:hypothetical protein